MKPPPFDYVRAHSVGEAVRALADAEGDGKIIAGGQSLVPLMALRIARPALLVDINPIPGLSGFSWAEFGAACDAGGVARGGGEEVPAIDGSVRADRGAVRIGALTRHSELARQRDHPLLAEAASWIGHPAIRSRGTVGGSLAHADPAAEIPVVAAAVDAVAHVAGPGSSRDIAAGNLFAGAFETVLADDEMITAATFPVPRRWGFAEFSRRHGDFGLVTVVAAEVDERIRIALGGVGSIPYRPAEAEAVLAGAAAAGDLVTPAVIDRAAASAAAEAPTFGDLHAPAEFRRAMTGEFTRRALSRLAAAPAIGAA